MGAPVDSPEARREVGKVRVEAWGRGPGAVVDSALGSPVALTAQTPCWRQANPELTGLAGSATVVKSPLGHRCPILSPSPGCAHQQGLTADARASISTHPAPCHCPSLLPDARPGAGTPAGAQGQLARWSHSNRQSHPQHQQGRLGLQGGNWNRSQWWRTRTGTPSPEPTPVCTWALELATGCSLSRSLGSGPDC